MKKNINNLFKFILLFIILFSALGQETFQDSSATDLMSTKERSLWTDTKVSAHWLLTASYEQFTEANNAYYLAVGMPITWYSFNIDRKFTASAKEKHISDLEKMSSELSIFMNFPFVFIGTWYIGKKTNDTKLMQFAMETAAASYLAIAESGLLSHIQIHHRPNTNGLNFFEKTFRGDSSWPSGHVIPCFALTFKTLQFYGPYWALVPAGLAYLTAAQRVKDARHWLSDITGAFFLTAFAAEGVRRVAKSKHNHPVYQWIFEHDAQVGIIHYENKIGPKLVWQF